ncbi:DUF742 domain-containing protein [Saccharopolyspora sp. SCSIO 74807]|uniref:DUF742 domain-containing protein n=1 Tax=Saccharopolyspora sp. SCSIO 74807 TaxID=3118084 RepID=UPI0030CF3D19
MDDSDFGEHEDRRRDDTGPQEGPEGTTFADVMNGFSFDSGRGGRRGRRKRAQRSEEPSEQPPQAGPAQPEQPQQPEPPQRQQSPGPPGPGQAPPPGPAPQQPGPPAPPPQPGRQPPGPPPDFQAQQPPGGWSTGPQPPVPPQPPPDWGSAGPARGVPATGGQRPAGQEWERPAAEWPAQDAESDVPAASSIRSYTWTGGRTRSNYELQMETLVSTSESYRSGAAGRMEHESIAELCRHPRSVAEVGAMLSVPIGVARVLLADMAELGMITVHQTVTESGSAPHMMLMERVLSGLRRL